MSEVKKTSLHEEHTALKAKMAPFAGFDMPLQYESVKLEAQAVRQNAGVFDVSHMGEFFVTGKEAIKFIDYAITNDFAGAEIGKAVYSPLCRENGTVIDDLIVYKLEEERVLVCVNAANIEKDFNWLNKIVENFDCILEDHSNNYSLLALQGPQSEPIMKALEILDSNEFTYYSAKETETKYGKLILARTGYTGEDGFEIFGTHEGIKTIWKDLLSKGVTPCGLASRDVLRLEVGYPLYGHELSDDWTPLDAGLKWTVKMEKEKFCGKEALETYKPKYRLAKLSLDKGIPREGYDVLNHNSEKVGWIASGTMSVALSKGIGIALIERDKFPEDKAFKIKVRNNEIEANYHAKAFVAGGHK
ncbi:MAG: glycine cleavage system aminomethyltransferase GcvT [Halobacteriovoraceae bacterium]|nr:glycine cleavage system aminomethyltransferase GcvT [Halobacteriovoraceae bacterium]